jgi:hypothetical protein
MNHVLSGTKESVDMLKDCQSVQKVRSVGWFLAVNVSMKINEEFKIMNSAYVVRVADNM